jgi:VanZ family protein
VAACCSRASCETRGGDHLELARRILDGYGRLPRLLRVLLVVAWMVVLWWLTDRPPGSLPAVPFHAIVMNSAHVLAFGALAALVFLAKEGTLLRRGVWSVGLTVVYGIATEVNQALGGSGRAGDPWDVVADAVGGVMFTAALVWVRSGSGRALWLGLAMVPAGVLAVTMAS